MQKFKELVAQKVSEHNGEKIIDVIADRMAQEEITSRINIVTEAVGRMNTISKHLSKLNRPDVKTFVKAGNEMQPQEVFSESRVKEMNTAKEGYGKIETAVNKCLDSNTAEDYERLRKALNDTNNIASNPGGKAKGADSGESKGTES